MTDLLSIVLKVTPAGAVPERTLPRWWGYAVYALLLQTITAQDAALAAGLHEDQAPPPFTATTLLGYSQRRGLQPGLEYALRFTALTAAVAEKLQTAVEPGGVLAPGAQIELDRLPFLVQRVCRDAAEHPWAGASSYNELASAHLLAGSELARRMTFQFASPATFKVNEMQMPAPLPAHVFGSLLGKWNAFAPLAFPEEVRRFAETCLAVSRMRLSSRGVALKEGVHRVGGIGEMTYTTLNYDRYWMGIVHTLAHFAFYAGVGASTGMGMGQCRLKPEGDAAGEPARQEG